MHTIHDEFTRDPLADLVDADLWPAPRAKPPGHRTWLCVIAGLGVLAGVVIARIFG